MLISIGISLLVYHRTGGTTELMKKIETGVSSDDLKKQMDTLTAMTDSLREKTADALDRLEKVVRKQKRRNRFKFGLSSRSSSLRVTI
jgi:hypothetical protein